MAAADRDLLFGLLALQTGLVDQAQLVAAFQAWTRDRSRRLADHLAVRGDLDADDRAAIEALADRHLRRHGGDARRGLSSIPVGRSTREGLGVPADPELTAAVARLGGGPAGSGDDPEGTAAYAVGTPSWGRPTSGSSSGTGWPPRRSGPSTPGSARTSC